MTAKGKYTNKKQYKINKIKNKACHHDPDHGLTPCQAAPN
jgi:hypothetical protein